MDDEERIMSLSEEQAMAEMLSVQEVGITAGRLTPWEKGA